VPRASLLSDLRSVLAERDFRRLFSVRLISQAGDGVVTAGVGTYVFFNASSFPSPSAAAAAFTVLYLPYSVIGPFAGVLIDRWSRRQILVFSALLRSAFVALTAAVMASGGRGVPLYVAVLLVLGVNRFFLASLSAALPHVVAEDKLVMANSVSPTVGGIVGAIGGIVVLGLNAATGEYGDMFAQGIIDPAKVTRSALQNAASIASLLLTTEALIADKPEPPAAHAGHGHGDEMAMM